MVTPDLVDETLSFGKLIFGAGHAFTAPAASNTNGSWAAVTKEMAELRGRVYLVESVKYGSIRKGLAALPSSGGSASLRPRRAGEGTNAYAALPVPPATMQTTVAPQKAKATEQAALARRPGMVIDYIAYVGVRATRICKGIPPTWFAMWSIAATC